MVAQKILRSFAYRRLLGRRTNLPARTRVGSAVLGGAALVGPAPLWPAGAWLLYRAVAGRSYFAENTGIRPTTADEEALLGVKHGRSFEHVVTLTCGAERAREIWCGRYPQAPDGTGAPVADFGDGTLGWRHPPNGEATAAARLQFEPMSHHRGTVVRLHYAYREPGAGIRSLAARVTPGSPWRRLRQALYDMKHVAETGEVPTTEGQPTGEGRAQ